MGLACKIILCTQVSLRSTFGNAELTQYSKGLGPKQLLFSGTWHLLDTLMVKT